MTDVIQALVKAGAPLLGTVIGGPVGTLAGAAIGALAEALGTPATAEAVTTAIQTRPEAGAIVRQVEAEKAPGYVEELQARLRDVQDARATTVELVKQNSLIAWGAPLYALSVVLAFDFVLIWLLITPVQISDAAGAILTILLGILTREMASVGGYYLGSSAGSAGKDAVIQTIARQATQPSAGQVAGKVIDAAVKSVTKR